MDRICAQKSVIELLDVVKDSSMLGVESITLYLLYMIKPNDFYKIDGVLKAYVKKEMLKMKFPSPYVDFLIENRLLKILP